MANLISILKIYERMCADERVTAWHISLFTALLLMNRDCPDSKTVTITRAQLMHQARIRSIVTYHKCMRQLQEFGFLIYLPSYNSYQKSKVEILF